MPAVSECVGVCIVHTERDARLGDTVLKQVNYVVLADMCLLMVDRRSGRLSAAVSAPQLLSSHDKQRLRGRGGHLPIHAPLTYCFHIGQLDVEGATCVQSSTINTWVKL